jgi:hypothetical protein
MYEGSQGSQLFLSYQQMLAATQQWFSNLKVQKNHLQGVKTPLPCCGSRGRAAAY